MNQAIHNVVGVILAGGQARRMGGIDKGLVPLAGKAMVEWVFDAMAAQVDRVVVNANRNHEAYGALSQHGMAVDVVPDIREGFLGPLSGMSSALAAIDTMPGVHSEWIVTVPCDSPFLPEDLVARLLASSREADIVTCHDGKRLQPVFSLIRRELRDSLDAFLDSGERKIDLWFQDHRHVNCDFSHTLDTFININTEEERELIEARLS